MPDPLVVERLDSRAGSWGRDPDNTLRFQVTGTEDDALAVAMVDTFAPLLYHGLLKQKIAIDPGEAPDIWYCDAQYSPMQRPEPGKVQWQFQLGGASTHITHALAHVASYVASGSAPNHQGRDQRPQGRQRGTGRRRRDIGGAGGAWTWSETHWIPYASFTPAYVRALYLMAVATPVNSGAWRVWSAGEVRLLGVSGTASGENQVELNFSFAAEPNVTGLIIGSIPDIVKKGWDYLWVEYETREDPGSHTMVKRPLAVHVEQVYGYGNFASLGLANVPLGITDGYPKTRPAWRARRTAVRRDPQRDGRRGAGLQASHGLADQQAGRRRLEPQRRPGPQRQRGQRTASLRAGHRRPIITPTDNLEAFHSGVALSCVRPDIALHLGKFVILLDPLKNGATSAAGSSRGSARWRSARWADYGVGRTWTMIRRLDCGLPKRASAKILPGSILNTLGTPGPSSSSAPAVLRRCGRPSKMTSNLADRPRRLSGMATRWRRRIAR